MNLKKMLIRHEGLIIKPYLCPAGKMTIGVGRNLEDMGISKEEALMMLDNDIRRVRLELEGYPWFKHLSAIRRDAITDMCFNLGISRFRLFRKTIQALEIGDYKIAADEMLDSRWARQVGARAAELAMMVHYDKYCDDI